MPREFLGRKGLTRKSTDLLTNVLYDLFVNGKVFGS